MNRIVRWTSEGWEVEADPRHAELIVEQLGLQGSKPVSTPGTDLEAKEDKEEESEELAGDDVRLYRGLAARCNYLSLDRPDLQFAAKEACREMSKPTVASLKRLKRIGRYLKGSPRVVWRMEYQEMPEELSVYTDANWAGCGRTRKSTSGGVAMWGSHCLKAWSKTQATVAKSSAESELFGVVRGSVEALGLCTLLKDAGIETRVRVHMDATAAKSIIERKGLAKVRHLDTDALWLQEQQVRKMLPLTKVLGTENPADLLTKNIGRETLDKYITKMRIEERSGRAGAAANLR